MGFWNENINPITMLPVPTPSNVESEKKRCRRNSKVLISEVEKCTNSMELIHMLGISTKKLKSLFKSIQIDPIRHNGRSYYPTKDIPLIKEMLIDNTVEVDKSQYISNQDLMRMFNFTEYKAWKIGKDNHLVKRKIGGNALYYEKEKAIAVFSKYVKK